MYSKFKLQHQYIKKRDASIKDKIKVYTDYQISIIAPKNLNPSDTKNYIKQIEMSFEDLCTSMEELGVKDPKRLSIFEFYGKIRYFEAKKSQKRPANTVSRPRR